MQGICFILYMIFVSNRNDFVLSEFKRELNLKAKEDNKYKEIQTMLSTIDK